MQGRRITALLALAAASLPPLAAPARAEPLPLPDPSIEATQEKNQFGIPYQKWNGWLFEGGGEFRVGKVARTGKTSAEMVGAPGVKMRLFSPAMTLTPGRYRFSCYIRGLDIGMHAWGLSMDVTFVDEQIKNLKKNGTFGWTKLEIVRDVEKAGDYVFRLGLWAPGRLWVDDATVERVGPETPLTDPVTFGPEERPIVPPGPLDAAHAVACPDCGYRNLPAWNACYACGAALAAPDTGRTGPDTRPLTGFEDGKIAPFAPSETGAASVVAEQASEGRYALRVDRGWAVWDGPQDWRGYDFLKVDTFNPHDDPARIYIEIQDAGTTGYWTRVNFNTVAPPGRSTLLVPTDIYVGEKSRPGRPLDAAHVKRLVLSVQDPKAPVFFDNLRLERDLSDSVKVPGLHAFSFGPGTAPPLRGFTSISPATVYAPGRGYGFKDARLWRAFDVLQPDPLYSRFICIEGGGFAVDLPDGKYHVFLNLDNPSGFWGEYQVYRQRSVKANGVEVVKDTMDLPRFLQRYFRFADVEDRPQENTFDKYQRAYFAEKEFDVEVRGGQLLLEFQGANWANSVSALVIYPAEQAKAGRAYLDNLTERRRFHFDNYFKRVLPDGRRDRKGPIPALAPTADETKKGYVLFARDWMDNVPVTAVPRREEVTKTLDVFASAGEGEPIVFSVHALKDGGDVTVSVGDLTGPAGRIPAAAVTPGVVSHRLSRVTNEGTVYTIAPRYVMPKATAALHKGTTSTFWLTLHAPAVVKAGVYTGKVTLRFADGRTDTLDLKARLFATPLDRVNVPVGPFGSGIPMPWYTEDLGEYRREMYRKSLARMRDYGLTSFSDVPSIRLRGWKDGVPDYDFTQADGQMADARAAGFDRMVANYGASVPGFNNYYIDEPAMKRAGFTDYGDFIRAAIAPIEAHAKAANWLPFAYNLCDEPIDADIARAAANAQAWRQAVPAGVVTTGATSVKSPKPDDPHLALARALKIANVNLHDEPAVRAMREGGSAWAFYNNSNRWTLGTYLFKAVRDFDMKYRLCWHWNASAGDPYYALDSREDDYAWCSANAAGELIPTITFERDVREGIDDYRYLQTLSRLVKEKPSHPAASAARQLIEGKLGAFQLGETRHADKWPAEEYRAFRLKVAEAIERLGK